MESPKSPTRDSQGQAPLSGHRRARMRIVSPSSRVLDDDDMLLREAEGSSHYLQGEGDGVDDEIEESVGATLLCLIVYYRI